MRVAVVGDTGYIAGYLLRRLQEELFIKKIIKIGRGKETDIYLDLFIPEKMDYSLLDTIDIVIFTAAVSSPDKCAIEYDKCYEVNVKGTQYFIQNAIEHGCKVIFFSSDAVFGDISGHIYTELSETNPKTAYGKMKKSVEDAFLDNEAFKSLRLSYVISENDRYIDYCLNCIRKRETAEVFHPFYRNCVSVTDVVDIVLWLLKNWDQFEPSVLNVAGRELVSRVRIADEINRCLENKLQYIITVPSDDFYKNRPPVTQMQSIYIKDYNILSDNTFTEKIKKEMENVIL